MGHGVKPVERAWVPVYSTWDTSLWSMGHQFIDHRHCGKTVSRVLFLTRVKSDEQLRVRRELYKFGMQTQDEDC